MWFLIIRFVRYSFYLTVQGIKQTENAMPSAAKFSKAHAFQLLSQGIGRTLQRLLFFSCSIRIHSFGILYSESHPHPFFFFFFHAQACHNFFLRQNLFFLLNIQNISTIYFTKPRFFMLANGQGHFKQYIKRLKSKNDKEETRVRVKLPRSTRPRPSHPIKHGFFTD